MKLKNNTVFEVLVDATSALADLGWTQNRMCDDGGCVCMLGAVRNAITGSPRVAPFGWDVWESEEEQRWAASLYDLTVAEIACTLGLALADDCLDNETAVSGWNDDPARVKAEVMRAMVATTQRVGER